VQRGRELALVRELLPCGEGTREDPRAELLEDAIRSPDRVQRLEV
jgi:hypothetical protein